jgi:enamine deaminase RidA (YjgF/YER057c/UK114 family)
LRFRSSLAALLSPTHGGLLATMQKTSMNPWNWQDRFGFSQAIEVKGGERVLYCAGQTSSDAEGKTQHPGDMKGQINLAFDNLEAVLAQAGMSLANVVRLNYYTPNVDLLLQHYSVLVERLDKVGCKPASTLLGVARLAFPDLLIEIEATAVA